MELKDSELDEVFQMWLNRSKQKGMTTFFSLPATFLQNCEFCFNMVRPNCWHMFNLMFVITPQVPLWRATLQSSLYWCMGLPHPRCRNLMKLLLVQLSRFSRPVWTEAPSISVPATLNYCHQQICRMCIYFFPHCWWRSSTIWTPVLTPGIFSFYLLPPSYVKPLAITHYFQQSQGYKTLCNNKEGTGEQNDMKW